MAGKPSNVEEHADQESETPRSPATPGPLEHHVRSATTLSRVGAMLGAIALILLIVLGGWLVRSVRRMNRQMTQIAQQMDRLNRRMGSTEQQSQSLAQQASQAAARAQAAAAQRDEAKQS